MSFVPEWIPVLKALESQKVSRLPFDNGKHLNLCRDDPVNCISVIGVSSQGSSLNRSSIMDETIEGSQLEPIREIRRDPELRDELVLKLERLVTETTLDEMQFVSFVDSLRNPVHLTQGP
jgi:hypothetical protein